MSSGPVVVAVLVRSVVLGLVVGLYHVLPFASDDALGTGLLAFATVLLLAGCWALVDGYRRGGRTALLQWTLVAVVLALGWWIAFAATQQDDSMSFGDLLAGDAGFVPLVLALVLIPAVAGAGIGAVVGRARREH